MKLVLYLLSLFILSHSFAQKMTIYCFPGQGANKHLFDSLKIDSSFSLKVIEYGTPPKNATMHSFALSLVNKIDTTENFILLGVSLGGMLCAELSEVLHPQKTIIISSAKNRAELPKRYKFQYKIPIYRLFPAQVLLWGAKMMQPIVEPDRNKFKRTFKKMLASKTPQYMKNSIPLIINWERTTNHSKIYHIHGKIDHTIPLRNIRNADFIVNDGSHMMTLTRANEISRIINKVLSE